MAVDITIRHPIPQLSGPDPDRVSAFFKDVEREKERSYKTLCRDNQWDFQAMVFDPWGGVHNSGLKLWKALTHTATARLQEQEKAEMITTLRRGLAVRLARAVATQLELLHLTHPIAPTHFPCPGFAITSEAGNEVWVDD